MAKTWQEFYLELAEKLVKEKDFQTLKKLKQEDFFDNVIKEWISKEIYSPFLVFWQLSFSKDEKIKKAAKLIFGDSYEVSIENKPKKLWKASQLIANNPNGNKQSSIEMLNKLFCLAYEYVKDANEENSKKLTECIQNLVSKGMNLGIRMANLSGMLSGVWPWVFISTTPEKKVNKILKNIDRKDLITPNNNGENYLKNCKEIKELIQSGTIKDESLFPKVLFLDTKNEAGKFIEEKTSGEKDWKELIANVEKIGDRKQPLNQILYGPPGTGKTYNSVVYAVAFCEGLVPQSLVEAIDSEKEKIQYSDVLKKYNELKVNEQIEFITFHQSYGYEEFIEGIKPHTTDKGQIEYKVENGIFKEFCCPKFAKGFDVAWEEFIKNEKQIQYNDKKGTKTAIWDDNNKKFYVEGIPSQDTLGANKEDVKNLYKKTFTKTGGSAEYTKKVGEIILEKLYKEYNLINNANKVFIIDEINRGNVSKIFGELITLIEDSKRISVDDEEKGMKVKLPYTGEEFGVPNNIYILGTMNTADRSLVQLDTALRRRFRFIEMMPKTEGIEDVGDIKLQNLLNSINKRICKQLDREHQIGHSYFIGVKELDQLKEVFEYNIIPLLQEYFYDDYEGIAKVLNDNGFISKDGDKYNDINKKAIKGATKEDFNNICEKEAVEKEDE